MGKNFHSIQGTSEEIAFFTWSDVRFFPFLKKCYIRFFSCGKYIQLSRLPDVNLTLTKIWKILKITIKAYNSDKFLNTAFP